MPPCTDCPHVLLPSFCGLIDRYWRADLLLLFLMFYFSALTLKPDQFEGNSPNLINLFLLLLFLSYCVLYFPFSWGHYIIILSKTTHLEVHLSLSPSCFGTRLHTANSDFFQKSEICTLPCSSAHTLHSLHPTLAKPDIILLCLLLLRQGYLKTELSPEAKNAEVLRQIYLLEMFLTLCSR